MGGVLAERLVRRIPQPVLDPPDEDDDLTHLFCRCTPDLALCGKNVAADLEVPPTDEVQADDCSLCVLTREVQPMCLRCGQE